MLLEVTGGNEKTSVELKISYRPKIELFKEIEPRVESLTVGASFDPKELIFRNYLNLLTSDSKIAVKVKFSEGKKSQLMKFGWFDPRLQLVESSQFSLNETAGVESLVPKLPSPLTPGLWTVVGLLADQLLYRETFLVLPGGQISGQMNQSHKQTAVKEDPSLEKYLDHQARLDGDPGSLIERFFTVEDHCGLEDPLPPCHNTPWSSFFPDRKSEILGIDPETGLIIEK